MTEYYEPMLYISTPEHPNTMGALVILKEEVDGDILRDVIGRLKERFPYYYVKVTNTENDLKTIDNPLPMIVRNSWEPITFNSKESNFHLAAWKYEGKCVAFEISHALTDGAGVIPYIKSAMYLYLCEKHQTRIDSKGFRLPGECIPESESGNPFSHLDIDNAEPPLFEKKKVADFYRLNNGEEIDYHMAMVQLDESQLMEYCRDFDGSPNAFLSVIFARAIRRYDKNSRQTITVSIAVDHKAMLGNYDNYRQFANVVEVHYPKDAPLDNLSKSCTAARGQIILQAQPENSLWAMKLRKATYAKLDQAPLKMKLEAMSKAAGAPRWSVAISYANSRSFGPLDPYIDQLYILAEPGVCDVICEISCINHHFYLNISRTFASNDFMDAFYKELDAIGIRYEVMAEGPLRLCGIQAFDNQ